METNESRANRTTIAFALPTGLVVLAVSILVASFWSPEARYYRALNVERQVREAKGDTIAMLSGFRDSAAKAIGVFWNFEGSFEQRHGHRPLTRSEFLSMEGDSSRFTWKNPLQFSYFSEVHGPQVHAQPLTVDMSMIGGPKYKTYTVAWWLGRQLHMCTSSQPSKMDCDLKDASATLWTHSSASRCEQELSFTQAKVDSIDRFAFFLCPSYSPSWAARSQDWLRQGKHGRPKLAP